MRATAGAAAAALVSNRRAEHSERSDSDAQAISVLIRNATATASVYLDVGPIDGGTTSVADGFEWRTTDAPLEVVIEPGQALYAISGGVAQTIHVLRKGR